MSRLEIAHHLRWLTLLVALAGLQAGCARWNWRGEGLGDDSGNYAARARAGTGGIKTGVDARARDIESNLGYR